MKVNIISENGIEKQPGAYGTTRYEARYIISGNNNWKFSLWSLIRLVMYS